VAGSGRMIQITAQMRVLVAVEPVDGRKGIDSLARLCQEKLAEDPFSGLRVRVPEPSRTAIRLLSYDGQGYWLAQKRLSKGRFVWWPEAGGATKPLEAYEAQLLMAAGDVSRVRCGADVAAGQCAEVTLRAEASGVFPNLRSKKSRFILLSMAAAATARSGTEAGKSVPNDILYIRELVGSHPGESRRALSKILCEMWGWRQANGTLRDMVCRGMLLMLERAGQIVLAAGEFVRPIHGPQSETGTTRSGPPAQHQQHPPGTPCRAACRWLAAIPTSRTIFR